MIVADFILRQLSVQIKDSQLNPLSELRIAFRLFINQQLVFQITAKIGRPFSCLAKKASIRLYAKMDFMRKNEGFWF